MAGSADGKDGALVCPIFFRRKIFRRIVDQLDVGVYIVDRARKIQYWNRGAEGLTGFLAQDVVGRFCRDNILVQRRSQPKPMW
jgi:PAS domain S-box-containing protein